jgi:hypothetical protein
LYLQYPGVKIQCIRAQPHEAAPHTNIDTELRSLQNAICGRLHHTEASLGPAGLYGCSQSRQARAAPASAKVSSWYVVRSRRTPAKVNIRLYENFYISHA